MTSDGTSDEHAHALKTWLRLSTGWHFINAQPKRLGVAVSGGSDSMATLDLMMWQAEDKGFEVNAVTVDHGLRPEAKREALQVAEFCASRGVPHYVLTWDWDGAGNLQGRAREARYRMIAEWARRRGVDCMALGHTRNDQAENMIMRLVRMSGVDGLAGMPGEFSRNGVRWVRPILRHRRSDLQDYLSNEGISWSDDPSNDDRGFERVRVRQASQVLAEIGLTQDTLIGIADNMQSAKWALETYTEREVQENQLVVEDCGDLIVQEGATADNPVPREILRRAQIAMLQWISGSPYPPRNHAMLNMVAGMAEANRHTLCGCVVTRINSKSGNDHHLRFSREFNAVKDVATSTEALWDGRWILTGPRDPALQVRALGEALKDCPDWRETGLPRASLLSSPAIWRETELIAAPLAGFSNGWTAEATGRGNFAEFLLSR